MILYVVSVEKVFSKIINPKTGCLVPKMFIGVKHAFLYILYSF